jgi:hypothetical protein
MMLHRLTKGYQLFGGYTVSIFKVELTWHHILHDHSLNLCSSKWYSTMLHIKYLLVFKTVLIICMYRSVHVMGLECSVFGHLPNERGCFSFAALTLACTTGDSYSWSGRVRKCRVASLAEERLMCIVYVLCEWILLYTNIWTENQWIGVHFSY